MFSYVIGVRSCERMHVSACVLVCLTLVCEMTHTSLKYKYKNCFQLKRHNTTQSNPFFPACSDNQYGSNCENSCPCIMSRIKSEHVNQSCDPKTGECYCVPEWSGSICNDDVDECTVGSDSNT